MSRHKADAHDNYSLPNWDFLICDCNRYSNPVAECMAAQDHEVPWKRATICRKQDAEVRHQHRHKSGQHRRNDQGT
ncbi:MAG: hypothetical protein KDA88_07250 [Planctomycetaceae bacterium]|nr:hypothetical protein [Planctomycetaceae bacterium]MCB9953924.1 hypothetical protein [Planctomycetaceae bacterium]